MPYISVLYPEESRQTAQIPEGGLFIGRSDFCDIQLSDEFVSARHCRIFPENGNLFIEDLGSTNGTSIDGTAIEALRATPLEPGQIVQIGISEMKLWN
jgi:pSer/pThr/pTyr-binding forkhead associated (FHA) protein